MIETWKKLCQLLKLTDLDDNECKDWTELEGYYQDDLSDLVDYLMLNTFDLITNFPNKKLEIVKSIIS